MLFVSEGEYNRLLRALAGESAWCLTCVANVQSNSVLPADDGHDGGGDAGRGGRDGGGRGEAARVVRGGRERRGAGEQRGQRQGDGAVVSAAGVQRPQSKLENWCADIGAWTQQASVENCEPVQMILCHSDPNRVGSDEQRTDILRWWQSPFPQALLCW